MDLWSPIGSLRLNIVINNSYGSCGVMRAPFTRNFAVRVAAPEAAYERCDLWVSCMQTIINPFLTTTLRELLTPKLLMWRKLKIYHN